MVNRRKALAGLSGAVGLISAAPALGQKPRRMRPQEGDVLVHAFGERAGAMLSAGDVGMRPVAAYAMDPASGVVRDGSLNNQLLVVRVAADDLSSKAARYAVPDAPGSDALIVYSASCTHTGCEINGWDDETRRLKCPCHDSQFDVADAARVVNGPAPRPLAMLRVALTDGALRVTGGFSRRVGPEPP